MRTVRALYDGTQLRPLPLKQFPVVERETQVTVIFDDVSENEEQTVLCQRREALERLRTARALISPLESSFREMIEDGRDRLNEMP